MQFRRIIATVWHDKRDVSLLSAVLNPLEQTKVEKRQKKNKFKIKCPVVVQQYTMGMGKLDLNDQYRTYYL